VVCQFFNRIGSPKTQHQEDGCQGIHPSSRTVQKLNWFSDHQQMTLLDPPSSTSRVCRGYCIPGLWRKQLDLWPPTYLVSWKSWAMILSITPLPVHIIYCLFSLQTHYPPKSSPSTILSTIKGEALSSYLKTWSSPTCHTKWHSIPARILLNVFEQSVKIPRAT
jgi:hypothetical protein